MAEYTTSIEWSCRDEEVFLSRRYSRRHLWNFDGGLSIPASSSPYVVPPPMSDTDAVDPEEALVAAVASCHMLTFLGIAAQRRLAVREYRDNAVGRMGELDGNRQFVEEIRLHPEITFAGEPPSTALLDRLHELAHRNCFVANSLTTRIVLARKR